MITADDIINGFRSRFVNDPRIASLSALDLLAMAYEEKCQEAAAANERAREAERRLETTKKSIAVEMTSSFKASVSLSPSDLQDVYTIRLSPKSIEHRSLRAHIDEWDSGVRDEIIKQSGRMFAKSIAEDWASGTR